MLDPSLMRGVWVEPAARRARAQAGCVPGEADRETQLHGLAAVLGFVSATGITGLTLGGVVAWSASEAPQVLELCRTFRCRRCSTPRSPRAGATTWKSEYLPRIEPAPCQETIEHAAALHSPHSAVILFQIEGTLHRRSEDYSATGNRDAR